MPTATCIATAYFKRDSLPPRFPRLFASRTICRTSVTQITHGLSGPSRPVLYSAVDGLGLIALSPFFRSHAAGHYPRGQLRNSGSIAADSRAASAELHTAMPLFAEILNAHRPHFADAATAIPDMIIAAASSRRYASLNSISHVIRSAPHFYRKRLARRAGHFEYALKQPPRTQFIFHALFVMMMLTREY